MKEKEWIEKFRRNLDYILYERGYTQRDFAKALGVTEAAVSYWIDGKRAPSVYSLINMSYLLHITIDELVDFGEPVHGTYGR